MRILLIHNHYTHPGGEETYVNELENLLVNQGHQVKTYFKFNRKISKKFVERMRIGLSMFWNFQGNSELDRLIKQFSPDLVHCNNIYPLINLSAYHTIRNNKIPLIQSIHNYRYMFPKSLLIRRGQRCPICLSKQLLNPWFLHKCYNENITYTFFFSLSHLFHTLIGTFNLVDKFIFPSKSTYAYFEKNTNINKKRFTILPNFVSTGGRDTYSKGSDFLYSGRLFVEKGILDLISVFKHRKLGNLLVLGNGNLKKSVAKAAAINKNIHYLGFKNRDKLVKIQSNAYSTIIPSKCLEVFPNVLLESLSVGTPVIAPNVAPFNEIIKNKVNGFLYDFNRVGSLEKAISLASKLKSKKYVAMRKNAIKKYKLFTPEAYYSQILSLYKSLNV